MCAIGKQFLCRRFHGCKDKAAAMPDAPIPAEQEGPALGILAAVTAVGV